MGYGSGITCWIRLRDWHEASVWKTLHVTLLEQLVWADAIDWERAAADSVSFRAKKGAQP